MNILIFAGTQNGRELALELAEIGHTVHVSSASAYGNSLLPDHDLIGSSFGKLDSQGILKLMDTFNPRCIIDSTHPYALDISKNLLEIMTLKQLPVLRYERYKSIPDNVGKHFTSFEQVCTYLNKLEGKVLFSTGVNDLPTIVAHMDLKRIVTRILPIPSSVNKAKSLGLKEEQTIALDPPFSLEDNLVHIKEHDIKFLVTKDSGQIGLVDEKIQACKKTGVELIVLDRPELGYKEVYYTLEQIMDALATITKGDL